MNDQGQIKEFANNSEALRAGYKHNLTPAEAEKLLNLQEPDRLPELIFWEYHKEVLKGRKMETIEKVKTRSAIKFAVEYMLTRQKGRDKLNELETLEEQKRE